jgi:hypothetical protein
MARGKRVGIAGKLLQELVDSCYALLLYRYRTEDMAEFSAPADQLMKQAQRVLKTARKLGLLPTGYEDATERLLDRSLRLRKQPAYEPTIEVVRNLSHTMVNRWIRDHFRIEGYDCAEDWNSDHIEALTVSLRQYNKEARRRVAQWKKDNFYDEPSLEEFLCELVRCGLLPEGNYEIWVD